jgi:hypothetical protein
MRRDSKAGKEKGTVHRRYDVKEGVILHFASCK